MNTSKDFWQKVMKTDKCWIWLGELDDYGYGRFSWQGKTGAKAHRVAYSLAFRRGVLPSSNSLVCHLCDNRACVRPRHLYLGSPPSNMQDRDNKGRKACTKGEKNGTHKLTDCDVRQIRESGLTQDQLAKRYSVTQSTISRIILRETWRHI